MTKAFVLALLSAAPCRLRPAVEPRPASQSAPEEPTAHLRLDDSVDDILEHPAFAGFGRLLLPWDDRRYDHAMPLRNIGSLLPYHAHVDPGRRGIGAQSNGR